MHVYEESMYCVNQITAIPYRKKLGRKTQKSKIESKSSKYKTGPQNTIAHHFRLFSYLKACDTKKTKASHTNVIFLRKYIEHSMVDDDKIPSQNSFAKFQISI